MGALSNSVSYLRKHWSLIPIVGLWGGSAVFMGSYFGYMCGWKPDVCWTPWKYDSHVPYMNIQSQEIKKIYARPEFKEKIAALTPSAEVVDLRADINAAYK